MSATFFIEFDAEVENDTLPEVVIENHLYLSGIYIDNHIIINY